MWYAPVPILESRLQGPWWSLNAYSRTGHKSPSRWHNTSQKPLGQFLWNLVNRLLIFFPGGIIFVPSCCYLQKKVISIFFFFTYKLGRGQPISKVSQTLKNVNQDPQGCPTIPHDHSMCLHHPVGAYLCVLSTIIFPYKSRKSKKKINFHHPNTRKDLGFCILVKSSQYKGEVRNSKFEKLIELCRVNVTGVYARSCYNIGG